MSRMRSAAAAVIVLVACATPAFAWGAAAHRYIMRRAIDLLPPPIKPFFDEQRDELIMRVVDPDLWRTAGWDDAPNHFVDFGVKEYGADPFTALPREYGAAIEKFGLATLRRNGTLPWREAEEFGNLRRAFEGAGRGAAYTRGDVVLFAAVASHYLQDAYQPLHATDNFDGERTGQAGVHARFETALFERFESRLTINPAPASPITNPRDAAFDVLLVSHRLVEPLLAADRAAVGSAHTYDDEYYERFFVGVKAMLERRISEAITATAGLIAGAWEQAGRPDLTAGRPRPGQRVRKPGGLR